AAARELRARRQRRAHGPRGRRVPRAAHRRVDGCRASGVAARAPRRSRGRRRVLLDPARRGPRSRARDAAARSGLRAHRREAPPTRRRVSELSTLTYDVDGRIARITLNRPERGNGITLEMPRELAGAVERAVLDPGVHVIALSGNGKGFCGGYDLVASAERSVEGVSDPGAAGGS